MRYGELIRSTFEIARRNPRLWFFGLFAGGGFSYSFNFDFSSKERGGSDGAVQQAPDALDPGVLVAIVVGGLLLIVLFLVLAVISHGGLASSVAAIDRGERRGFADTWRAGRARFWRVLGLGVLLFLIGLAALLVVVAPLAGIVVAGFVLSDSVAVAVVAVLAVILLALAAIAFVFIPLTAIAHFALRTLVLRGERVTESLRAGWRLFRRNFGRSLLLWLIVFGITLGIGLAILLAALLLAAPAIVLAVTGSPAALAVAIVTGVILVPLLLIASAAVGTFGHGYWTLAFVRLEQSAPAYG
jgi:hypothetical protein